MFFSNVKCFPKQQGLYEGEGRSHSVGIKPYVQYKNKMQLMKVIVGSSYAQR